MDADVRRRADKRLLTPKPCRECGELVYWDDTEPVVCDECRERERDDGR
jgi:formylmethanofuran dehydrogenase subunit E